VKLPVLPCRFCPLTNAERGNLTVANIVCACRKCTDSWAVQRSRWAMGLDLFDEKTDGEN